MVAVTLASNGNNITSEDEVVYALSDNGNLGMTSPEKSGASENYTYGVYIKYKNGDYTDTDAGDKEYKVKLIVVGKGTINLDFLLQAEAYTA